MDSEREPWAIIGSLYRLKVSWFRPDTDKVFEEVTIDYEAAWRHYFKGELPPEGGAYDHFCNAVNLALGITEDTG